MGLLEGKTPTKAIPLGAILTLPATGSESNGTSVISKNSTNEKDILLHLWYIQNLQYWTHQLWIV